MNLFVRFFKRDFTTALAFPDVRFEVTRYSKHRMGGCEIAELRATGAPWALWELANWLRAPAEIIDEYGEVVWWGYLAELTIGVGAMELGLGLDGMANTVAVAYTDASDGGTPVNGTTPWATDADSVATYGTWALLAQLEDSGPDAALAWRDSLLEMFKYPPAVIRHGPGQSDLEAAVRLRGWWFALASEYYSNPATQEAETTAQIATIAATSQFITGTDVQAASGVMVTQFQDGTKRIREIVEQLVDTGMSDGDRLIANITRERVLQVWEEPTADRLYLLPDGQVTDTWGTVELNRRCPVALWCRLRDVVPPTVNVAKLAPIDRFFVERSEFSPPDGRLVLEPRGQESPWSEGGLGGGGGNWDGWLGRWEGPRVGLFRLENEDDGTFSIFFAAADTSNRPFASIGIRNFKSNSRWLKLGYEGKAQIYLAAPNSDETDPEEPTDLVVETGCLESAGASDGDVLTADGSGGAAWEAPAAGSAGTISVWRADAQPASPSAYDDEFSDSSVDGKWTEFDPGGVCTVAEDDSGLTLTVTSGAYKVCGVFQAVPGSGDWTIWTKISLSGKQADYIYGGLVLGQDMTNNPATSDLYTWHYLLGNGSIYLQINQWSDYATWAATTATLNDVIANTHCYLRIRKNNATYEFDWSSDGVGWHRFYSGTLAFTPAEFGLFAVNNGTGVTMKATFAFFREVAGTLAVTNLAEGRRVLWSEA